MPQPSGIGVLRVEFVPDDYEYVILHDGARPLISPDLIAHTIATLKGNIDCDGAVVAHPAVDTLKVVENGVIVGTPDRRVFWNAQMPQVFRAGIYRRAHASALSDGFMGTDDSSLIERLGGRVLVVEGKRDNIKLTVPEDYLMLAAAVRTMYMKGRKNDHPPGGLGDSAQSLRQFLLARNARWAFRLVRNSLVGTVAKAAHVVIGGTE